MKELIFDIIGTCLLWLAGFSITIILVMVGITLLFSTQMFVPYMIKLCGFILLCLLFGGMSKYISEN